MCFFFIVGYIISPFAKDTSVLSQYTVIPTKTFRNKTGKRKRGKKKKREKRKEKKKEEKLERERGKRSGKEKDYAYQLIVPSGSGYR